MSSGDGSGNGVIVARLIHSITVTQPGLSWTVTRDHVDFVTLGNALSTVIAGIPQCPPAPSFAQPSNEVSDILKVSHAAQAWLANALLFPGARESPAVRQFLTFGANMVPAQYGEIQWITPSDYELEMDEMFSYDDVSSDDEEDDYVDDNEFFSATERYQPTIEAVTQNDIMDFHNNADDVEMIEDVGSLAQSMGASHLGRSLQLQAEVSGYRKGNVAPPQAQQGLNIGRGSGTSISSTGSGGIGGIGGIGGGIGNAVAGIQQESVVEGLSDSFYQKAPISLPRLDSFKMIKVVGKGSFGTSMFISYLSTMDTTSRVV